jgi:hypothetical protein
MPKSGPFINDKIITVGFFYKPTTYNPSMAPMNITPVTIGTVVRLRKPHPCGGYEWTVSRVGADIGLKCRICGHRVMLTRREFERRLDRVVEEAGPTHPDHPNQDRAEP